MDLHEDGMSLLGMMTYVQKHLLTNGILIIDACGPSSKLRGHDLSK